MSRREDIDNSIWHDPDFEELSLPAQHLYLWSFTNPRCGMAGIYKVSKRAMAEPRLTPEQVTDALEELASARFVFYHEGVLWVRTRVRHLRTKTEQIAKSIAADLEKIPDDHPLLRGFLAEYEGTTWLEPHLNLNGSHQKAKNRTSVEPRPRFQGKGLGKGEQPFTSWLEHYHEVTGRHDVRGSKPARDQFTARLRDGFSLDELKLATIGCHGDRFCRENKHDVPETILRASKITRYIELGRELAPPQRPRQSREQRIAQLRRLGIPLDEAEQAVA